MRAVYISRWVRDIRCGRCRKLNMSDVHRHYLKMENKNTSPSSRRRFPLLRSPSLNERRLPDGVPVPSS